MISAIGCLVVATTVGARPAHRERVSPLNQQHAGNGAGVRQNGLATQQSTFEDLRLCAKKERKSSYTYKDVAGPASEFASMAQPDEASLSAYSGHFATQFTFTPAADAAAAVTFTQEIVVDSASGFAISAFTVDSKDTTFTLTAADGKEVDLTKVQSEVSLPMGDDGFRLVNGTQWDFNTPPPQGKYSFTISSTAHAVIGAAREERAARNPTAKAADGYILYWNESPEKLYAHMSNSNNPVVGSKVGVVARLVDASKHDGAVWTRSSISPPVSAAQVVAGTLMTVFPDGTTSSAPMEDDGLHSDGGVGDGEYGGDVMATQVGLYQFHATFTGQDAQGNMFVRSYQQDMMVDSPSVKLMTYAVATADKKNKRLDIKIPISVSSCAGKSATYRPYFELWGQKTTTTGSGAAATTTITAVPIAFATSLAQVQSTLFANYLSLSVDMKWFQAAGVTSGPFTLKNVLLQNIDTLAAVSEATAISVSTIKADEWATATEHAALAAGSTTGGVSDVEATMATLPAYDGEITWEMRNGIAPPRVASGAAGKLVLMHGFCADKNPFEMQPADWTDVVYYSAAREGDALGRSNHQFAEDVLGFIERQGLDTFGLLGQSQGGMISLHILNFYHTGLDSAVGARKIQSVATPYEGNTALSSLNGIIDIVGGIAGCQGPYDLTRSGAGEWLAGIAPENVAETNYYYTQYSKGGLFGNGWCNTAMNLLLDGKNDGVCEVAYATPAGKGNDRGNVEGWCHAEDMQWPPSFWDVDRNKEMNDNAAR